MNLEGGEALAKVGEALDLLVKERGVAEGVKGLCAAVFDGSESA